MRGGCLCGRVRYTITRPIEFTAVCHCNHCQRQSGSAFSVIAAVPREAFILEGPTRTFVDAGDSGHPVERVFCPECGSPLYSTTYRGRNRVYVKVGTLDETGVVHPTSEIYGDVKQKWLHDFNLSVFQLGTEP